MLNISRLQIHKDLLFLIKNKTGSRAFSIAGPALWNALHVPLRKSPKKLPFQKPRLPVDEPVLAWIMTHDHAEDLSASELGSLRL